MRISVSHGVRGLGGSAGAAREDKRDGEQGNGENAARHVLFTFRFFRCAGVPYYSTRLVFREASCKGEWRGVVSIRDLVILILNLSEVY